MEYLKDQKVDLGKINAGIQFHANTFNLTSQGDHGIGAKSNGPGGAGERSRHPGRLGFDEVSRILRVSLISQS